MKQNECQAFLQENFPGSWLRMGESQIYLLNSPGAAIGHFIHDEDTSCEKAIWRGLIDHHHIHDFANMEEVRIFYKTNFKLQAFK